MTTIDGNRERTGSRKGRGSWRALVLGVGAALLYGSWAYFANLNAGADRGLRAGLVQALLSFTATVALVVLMERLFAIGGSPGRGFWLAGPGSSSVAALVMASAHGIAGTPHLLLTIAPSLVIGTAFCFAYAAGLRRSALA